VSWRPKPGVQKSTSFSILKYGEEQALAKAKAFRTRMMKQVYGKAAYKRIEARRQDMQKLYPGICGSTDTDVTGDEFSWALPAALHTQSEFDAAKSFDLDQMRRTGFGPWGDGDLWLIPGHWYKDLPQGYTFTSISFKDTVFTPGTSDDDTGYLSFGIINHRASAELALRKSSSCPKI